MIAPCHYGTTFRIFWHGVTIAPCHSYPKPHFFGLRGAIIAPGQKILNIGFFSFVPTYFSLFLHELNSVLPNYLVSFAFASSLFLFFPL